MEIVKELNLNCNPQNVKNGSLVFAKNIRLSADGSYITNDYGFEEAIKDASQKSRVDLKISNIRIGGNGINYRKTPEEFNSKRIVGYINCPNEIVLLTYDWTNDTSAIYRLIEDKANTGLFPIYVPTAWEYHGGEIVGTYIYNVNNELIVSIGESGNTFGEEDIPLYTINLNKSETSDSIHNYTTAPNVPIANVQYINYVSGKPMRCGLYYFYVRYKISYNNYTNWFPIGVPKYVINKEINELVNHTYWAKNNLDQHTLNYTAKVSTYVNDDSNSIFNLEMLLKLDNVTNYKEFQLGYIVQTDNAIVGRIHGNFSIQDNGESLIVFDGSHIEEFSIDDIIKPVNKISEVKALTNFENKLYAANFKETNYNYFDNTLIDSAEAIDVKQLIRPADIELETSFANENYEYDLKYYDDSQIKSKTFRANSSSASTTMLLKDVKNITDNTDTIFDFFKDRIVIASELQSKTLEEIKALFEHGRNIFYITFNNNTILLNGGFNDSTGNIRLVSHTDNGGFSPDENLGEVASYIEIRDYSPAIGYDTIGYIKIYDIDTIIDNSVTSATQGAASNKYEIRSLNPYQVYSFYVHYVRADGSYTNGIKLNNKASNIYTKDNVDFDLTNTLKQYKDRQDTSVSIDCLENIKNVEALENIQLFELLNEKYIEQGATVLDVEKDFQYYENISGDKLFKTGSSIIKTNDNKLHICSIDVRFHNIVIPEGYVGCFFSYETPATNVYTGIITDVNIQDANRDTCVLMKATEIETALEQYDGSVLYPLYKYDASEYNSYLPISGNEEHYIKNSYAIKSNCAKNGVSLEGKHGGIIHALNEPTTLLSNVEEDKYIVCAVLRFNKKVYTNTLTPLIPFGKIINVYSQEYLDSDAEESEEYVMEYIGDNYPSFITLDLAFIYSNYNVDSGGLEYIMGGGISIDSATGEVTFIGGNTYYKHDNYAKLLSYIKYSNYNLSAISIKEPPTHIINVSTINTGTGERTHNYNNTYIYPLNASDLFELKSFYFYNQYKVYTRYDENLNYENVTPNMIRCSNPIRTESGENSWRIFDADDYYLIDKKAGEIVNIFAVSKYFYIHTKNTLMIATSDAKLTADNTTISVTNHKLFDVAPSELFTSDLGYGGLKHRVCSLFCQYGYFWYDTEHRKLFRYDNNKLVDLTAYIEEVVANSDFEMCFINVDTANNSMLFCFDNQRYEESNRYRRIITFSYSTLVDKFISVLDYKFEHSMHTTNKLLIPCTYNTGSKIYQYFKNSYTDYLYAVNSYDRFTLYNIPDTQRRASWFDVIFNMNYNIPKVLDSIKWVHEIFDTNILDNNKPETYKFLNNIIRDKIKDIKGFSILIYTDVVDTGRLQLYTDDLKLNETNATNPNSYKYPYYNKGVWNFNYFRNKISSPVKDTNIQDLITSITGYTTPTDTDKINKIINELLVYKDKDNNDIYYRPSDLESLVYGKYFVIRFIYTGEKKFKFDNLDINIKQY